MKKGFTLIELLVVVLIIGILSAVALPQYNVAVGKSQATEGFLNIKNIYRAQKLYYMANGVYTDKLSELDFSLPVNASEYAQGKYYSFYCISSSRFCQTNSKKDNLPDFNILLNHEEEFYCICKTSETRSCKICKSLGGVFSRTNSSSDYYKMHF